MHDPARRCCRREKIEQSSPTCRCLFSEDSGEHGTDEIPHPDAGTENALVFAAFLERYDVGDDHHGQTGDSASRDAGEAAEDVEHWCGAGDAAHQICECEHCQRGEVDEFAAEEVGEAAVEHLEDGVAD